jgi:predicted lipoprotein
MRSFVLAALALAAMLCGGQASAAESPVVKGAIEGFAKPAYAEFHGAAEQMRTEMEALCADPSPDKLAAARSTFLILVNTWSSAELIRFGPVTEDNRLERILYWPDRKGIGLKQVQAAIAGKDQSAADPVTLKGKSVAMQGMAALEFVIFGTGAEELQEPAADSYRCSYGRAVATNIEIMAAEIRTAWLDHRGIAFQWGNPSPDNPLYRTNEEALRELLGIMVHGLENVRDVRLDGFLGDKPGDDKPKLAIYWRSGGTVISLRSAMVGMRSLFDTSGLATLLGQEQSWIAQSISFEFEHAQGFLDLGSGPIADSLTNETKRQALATFRLITSHLSDLIGVTVAGQLGISAGFSSLDGD